MFMRTLPMTLMLFAALIALSDAGALMQRTAAYLIVASFAVMIIQVLAIWYKRYNGS